eukprot:6198072-Pleurochrysis_carterae.AAC.1
MTEDGTTLFAVFKASGLPASLKGEILCHHCLDWGRVANDKSGKPVCPSAVKTRRPGDCINGVHFLKLRDNNGSGSYPPSPSVLKRHKSVWQALVANYHAPALNCGAFQMQRAVAATMIAPQISAYLNEREISYEIGQSHSHDRTHRQDFDPTRLLGRPATWHRLARRPSL